MAVRKGKPKAVVDTSFWIHLVKLNLVESVIQLWDIVVTKKVEEELLAFTKIKLYTPLDLEIYNELKSNGTIQVKDPKSIPGDISSQITSNSGELESIALAREDKVIVFIDNGIPYEFCKRNNIEVMNTLDLCFLLLKLNKLSEEEVLQKINQLEKLKSMKLKYIEKARKELM